MIDTEAEARAILERAGYSIHDTPGARALVAQLRVPVERVPARALCGAEAEICRVRGEHRIYVARGLPPARFAFAVMHELAHWHLGLMHHDPQVESACDAIAGALTCPRGAFRCAIAERGRAWEQLALDFGTDASCVALRYGEVLDVPLVLVAPRTVRVRGPEFGWPYDEIALRRLAKCSPSGLVRERLPDDARRTLIVAA